MPERPRTWALMMCRPSGEDGVEEYPAAIDGPDLGWDERVEVVEKAPVDAERERMLDLLERIYVAYMTYSDAGEHAARATQGLLEKHGRLSGEERA